MIYYNMEMNENTFLGKLEKNGCYVNNGNYGYFYILHVTKRTCEFLEFLLPEEVT